MEGTITQLGLQNYLINEKLEKESLFKHSYKNHMNFARDTRKVQFDNSVDFGKDISFKISENGRYGDLINNITLEFELPDLTDLLTTTNNQVGYCNGIGYAMIKEVILKIGGNVINKLSSEWMHTWSRFTIPHGKIDVFNDGIKFFFTNASSNFKGGLVTIPLMFWFSQICNTSYKNKLIFPLIAMRNAEIELIVKLKPLHELLISNDNSSLTVQQLNSLHIENNNILIDYIILTTEERLKYLNAKKQIYLITQIQEERYSILANSTVAKININNFKYPITELFWFIRSNTNLLRKDYFNYTDALTGDPSRQGYYTTAKLIFDGRERTPELSSNSFTIIEPLKMHTNAPLKSQISCYSFALEPENLGQPTGNCNFSGLHEPILHLKLKSNIPQSDFFIYGINYNVLQIDDRGNVWLLHNLSKSSPSELPDINNPSYSEQCNLSINEANKAKELIAEINKLNLFTDGRQIETALQNIINEEKRKEIINLRGDDNCIDTNEGEFDLGHVNPLLSSLIAEVKRINNVMNDNESNIITRDNIRFVDVGGMLININNIESFLHHLKTSSNSNFNSKS
jgi:hypothetical protein